jgi:SAM-dependent methyltransferase
VTAETLEQARERLRPYVERAQTFTGWMPDVPFRPLGTTQPWDYAGRARHLMNGAGRVLDMGTGGGERFGDVLTGFRGTAIATEEWHVNAPIAAARLRPLGADVVRCQSIRLPFDDATFDLVLNRHEDLDPQDVARVLQPGGRVLTQQAWNIWREIGRFILRRVFLATLFEDYRDGFAAAGFQIIDARAREWPAAYSTLGDLVYMLCIAPWEIPDFDPLGADLEALLGLEAALSTPEGLVLTNGSFIIEALKPS